MNALDSLGLPWASIRLGEVEPAAVAGYERWLAEGRQGEMHYLEKYPAIRRDPRELLPGARSLVAVAFPYFTEERIPLKISLYARGRDYHEVVRERLEAVAAELSPEPGSWRVCVDTAPLRERYWAARAGLGFIGRNNQLIVPGWGSYVFLGFILTSRELPERRFCAEGLGCGDCRRCFQACPGRALEADGGAMDARKCLSYLTIEYRGEFPEGTKLPTLYGCDVCQQVCPFNRGVPATPIADFRPAPGLATLTPAALAAMTPETFRALFSHSAIRRAKLPALLRNLSALRP